MDFKEFRSEKTKNKSIITESLKNNLRCISSALLRCILPWEEEILKSDSKQKKAIKSGIFYFVLSFLLGLSILSNNLSPFGLAVLCACYGPITAVCFCGVSAGCFFRGLEGLISFICYFLLFLIRKSISGGKFNESAASRTAYALIISTFLGAYRLFTDRINGISLITYFTYILLTVLCVYLYIGTLGTGKASCSPGYYLISIYSVCVCIIPSLNTISFPGIDFGIIFASFLTLWFSKCKGPVYGCVSGFLFGFSCMNPLYSAPLGIGGLIAGYLFTKSTAVSCFVFTFSTMFCHLYLSGKDSLDIFLPFTFCASLIYLAVNRYIPDIFSRTEPSVILKDRKHPMTNESEFDKVSDSLTGLSSVICKFAEHMKAPANAETLKIIDDSFDEVCKNCSMSNFCYAKRECDFGNVRSKIASILKTAPLKHEEFSSFLLDKCIRCEQICDSINKAYSDLYFFTMKANRTQSVGRLYNSMSHLIKNTAERETKSKERDTRLEEAISTALKKIGVIHTYARVYGKRRKSVYIHGIRADKIPCSSKELCEYLSNECRIRFTDPSFDISDSADMVMKFSRSTILSVEYAQCCEAKDSESVNGDTISFFDTSDDYFYSIIADGMGSGKTAAATSRLSCVFLEKMLCAGTAKNICIEMLNNLLLSKNDEAFSGIDLLEIDRLTGTAYFIKAGAAPSFVLRKSRIYKICSETPPVGIIPAFSAESTRFTLEKGDIIFMVSDGVIQSDSDAVWLSGLIGAETDTEPALLAGRLIEKSKSFGSRNDDASACVIKIN